MKAEVPIQRLAKLLLRQRCVEKEAKATDIETLIYLMTACLARPLSEEYFEIYMHLARKAFDWQGKKEVPEYLQGYEALDEYKMSLLDGLKKKIYEAQESHYREKKRVARSNLKNGERDNNKGFDYEQLKLF